MLPSQIPIHRTSECNVLAYATASALLRISGSETISSKGVPARLKSTSDEPSAQAAGVDKVAQVVSDTRPEFADVPIRDFVPLFVERGAKQRLREIA